MSAISALQVHPTRSVRRTSGLVLVGDPEVNLLPRSEMRSSNAIVPGKLVFV